MRASAVADDIDIVVLRHRRRAPARERPASPGGRAAARARSPSQNRRPADGPATTVPSFAREPDGGRLGDQVTDREDEAVVADHDAVARAIGAEDRRGERVVRNLGAQRDHAVERRLEVEADLALRRLQRRRESPAGEFDHDGARLRNGRSAGREAPASSECYRTPAGGGTRRPPRGRDARIARTCGRMAASPCRPRPMRLVALCSNVLALLLAGAAPAHAQVAPSTTERAGYTGLFAAAARGDAAEIARLVRRRRRCHGARRQCAARRCTSPPSRRNATAMRALVKAGADPNALDDDRYDIVTIAAVANDLPTLKDGARARRQRAATSPVATTAPRSSPPRISAMSRSCAS